MQIFILFIGTIMLVLGVKLIYDARLIVKKYFSVNDRNSATLLLKIFGTILVVIGSLLVSQTL